MSTRKYFQQVNNCPYTFSVSYSVNYCTQYQADMLIHANCGCYTTLAYSARLSIIQGLTDECKQIHICGTRLSLQSTNNVRNTCQQSPVLGQSEDPSTDTDLSYRDNRQHITQLFTNRCLGNTQHRYQSTDKLQQAISTAYVET